MLTPVQITPVLLTPVLQKITTPLILANSASSALVFNVLMVLGPALIAFSAIYIFRDRLKNAGQDESDAKPASAFTLLDLRRLYEQGQLSDDEFEFAKARMLENLTRDPTTDETDLAADDLETEVKDRLRIQSSNPSSATTDPEQDSPDDDPELGPELLPNPDHPQ